ncbi:MAG: NAD-dependent epimerase, partial [Flavobacteriales bacterium]
AIRVRTSYNLAAMSFTPQDVAESIRAVVPNFQIEYAPDHRQAIASSWPESINDQQARDDWGWNPEIGLTELTQIMLDGISAKAHEVTG